jgi:hypothetical protein
MLEQLYFGTFDIRHKLKGINLVLTSAPPGMEFAVIGAETLRNKGETLLAV